MKILILGGTGMLGHRLWLTLSRNHDVYATVRVSEESDKIKSLSKLKDKTFFNVDVSNINSVERIICQLKPDVVFNCVGIIKQLKESSDDVISLELNSLLPHKISRLCDEYNSRFIHFSTDCVFDGQKGDYVETDEANTIDLYGKSKNMGEVTNSKNALTIRTSIIGKELGSKESLVEWFLCQKEVKGFSKAIFSGFPTYSLSKIINEYVLEDKSLSGVIHISSDPISKYDLLKKINDAFNLNIKINKDTSFEINRSLNSDKFRQKCSYVPENWNDLVKDLLIEESIYKN